MTIAYLNRIATGAPVNEVHASFIKFAKTMLSADKAKLFQRMADKAAINHRYSVIEAWQDPEAETNKGHFYERGHFPTTSARMDLYQILAPVLARATVDRLALGKAAKAITHVIVTSCTGMYAPGLDLDLITHLGLNPTVERTMIGFMGCYAAINALKLARHIVRSEPASQVLILNLELCTLHLQETQDLEQILSFLVFADGCAASIVSAEPVGLALDRFHAVLVPETADLITWRVGALGFDMMLSGRVPSVIRDALRTMMPAIIAPHSKNDIALWAVHPGGRSVLDAVETGTELPQNALKTSRAILAEFGNMSSATIMFVLQKLMQEAKPGQQGCALSFGPGLTAETFLFEAA